MIDPLARNLAIEVADLKLVPGGAQPRLARSVIK